MKADKKNRIHVVYSTDPNYNYEYNNEKDGEIIIQGEVKEKVLNILRENKYRAK